MAHRPAQSRRPTRSRRPVLTPTLIATVLFVLGAISLEREGMLPEPLAGIVRDVETVALEPLLAALGLEAPTDRPTDTPRDGSVDVAEARALLDQIRVEPERRAGYVRKGRLRPRGLAVSAISAFETDRA